MIFSSDDPATVAFAADSLRQGGVVLVPTETVYGLVCNWHCQDAREKIFVLKNRPASKLLGCFIRDFSQLPDVVMPDHAAELAAKFMPGALTLILPQKNGGTIGVRMPDHAFLQQLLEKVDFPLAQTSANLSGRADAQSCREALDMLCGKVDCAVDGGSIPPGAAASTVVDCTGPAPEILRQGSIHIDTMEKKV